MAPMIPTDPRPSFALLLALSAIASALAGCVSESAGSERSTPSVQSLAAPRITLPDASWAEAALAFEDPHNHADALQHQGLSTPNFEILGYDPLLSPDYGTTAFGYLCGDAKATRDGRRLAVVESRSDVAFAIADVTDPRDPKWLGELVMRRTYVYDVAVVPDGRHVVLVTTDVIQPDPRSLSDEERSADGDLLWRSPCDPRPTPVRTLDAEDPVPRPLSLLLVSIADPTRPTIVDQRPLLGYGHGIFSTTVDGRTWVVATTYAQNSGLSNYEFYEIVTTPAGSFLAHLATYAPAQDLPPDEWTRPLGHTDAWIYKHPKTNRTYAWLAHWNSGLLILDLTNPSAPELVGRWTDYDASKRPGDSGATHSVYPMAELWGGRHFTVIGPELAARPPSTPTGIVWVLDTTDPGRPFEVAAWTLPHDLQWTGRLQFSTHYLTVVNRTAFVSLYHAGIWALDLSDVAAHEFSLLPSVGAFLPSDVSPKPPKQPFRWTPTVEEVHAFADGTLVTFDSNSGLYTLRFDEANPMPAPAPWPLASVRAKP